MNRHPDGLDQTTELLQLAGPSPPARILDLGAGAGESVALLCDLGFDARGIDHTAADGVQIGDITALPFPADTFDACLAECSFSTCGDGRAAFREAFRVLKSGGLLMLSDVFFDSDTAPMLSLNRPATMENWLTEASLHGFFLRMTADKTAVWKQYYLECVWNGTADCLPAELKGQFGAGYFLLVCEKP